MKRGKLEILSKTSMVDLAMDVHKHLYPDLEVPASLKERRVGILNNFKQLQAETEPALKIFSRDDVDEQIKQSRDSKQLLEFLVTNHNFNPELVDTCYKFAKVIINLSQIISFLNLFENKTTLILMHLNKIYFLYSGSV